MLFKYRDLDSGKLSEHLENYGSVEIVLSSRQAKITTKALRIVSKMVQAPDDDDRPLRKIDLYKLMLLNFWMMISCSAIIEIVTFYTLKKPKLGATTRSEDGYHLAFEATTQNNDG